MTTYLTLSDGMRMPAIGFGLYKVSDEDAESAATTALTAGYRLLDTATLYGNERGTGRAVRASGLDRDEVFVTTKLWNDAHGEREARAAFAESVERLGLGAPDLYLIHWPAPERGRYVETWRTLVALRDEGRVRSVGVSNFQPEHLEKVVHDTDEVPVVNQVELHPYLQQRELRALHAELGVITQAWSPLGRGAVLQDPVLTDIAARHGVTDFGITATLRSRCHRSTTCAGVTPCRA
ncbi:MAG: aldo/keto reductase, partial [Actinomycetales bacterium]